MAADFDILARDPGSQARAGILRTAHGEVRTPAFVPLATKGTVRGLLPSEVAGLGYDMVLGNTFHLHLEPGDDLIARQGGLHRFMAWDGPIITDSGGFQVFSMGHGTVADEVKGRAPSGPDRAGRILEIREDGVRFRSYLDGSEKFIGPETSMEIQANLGSDIALVFDECTPFHVEREYTLRSTERTHRWLERCVRRHRELDGEASGQTLFGIVQGGAFEDLRARSVEAVTSHDLVGYAIGGVSVGETRDAMRIAVRSAAPRLPEDRPRYLMGVGTPLDFVEAVAEGIDLFDCVTPTRHGRTKQAFSSQGLVNIENARFARDPRPLDPRCACPACRGFSRGTLRHLAKSDEMLGAILLTLHNLRFFHALFDDLRAAIEFGGWAELAARVEGDMARVLPPEL